MSSPPKWLRDRVKTLEGRAARRDAPMRWVASFIASDGNGRPAGYETGLLIIEEGAPSITFDLAPPVPAEALRRATTIRLPIIADAEKAEAALRYALELAAEEGIDASGALVLPQATSVEEWERAAAATPPPPAGDPTPATHTQATCVASSKEDA